jgi:hypothetical protein
MLNYRNPMSKLSFSPLSASLLGAIGIVAVAMAAPANAATVDFSTTPWSSTGNASSGAPGSATLSTGSSPIAPTDALPPSNALQTFLGVGAGDLDTSSGDQAFEGSAFLANFAAGDTLTFNWTFSLFPNDLDYAFVLLPGLSTPTVLSGSSGTFNTTFASAGRFAVGIVDIGDAAGDSTFSISAADATPVPAPIAAPAALIAIAGMGYKKLRQRKAS